MFNKELDYFMLKFIGVSLKSVLYLPIRAKFIKWFCDGSLF